MSRSNQLVRSDIEKVIASATNFPRQEIPRLLDLIFDEMRDAMIRGRSIEIRGLGTFRTSFSKARVGVHPATREPLVIESKGKVRFKPSKSIQEPLDAAALRAS